MKRTNIILTIATILMLLIFILWFTIAYKQISIQNIETTFYKSNLEFIENNKENIFSINKITYFSSCNANATTNSNSTFIISDLYQYTDIAIFINNHSENGLTMKNTLKSVTVNNFNYEISPNIGTPSLYYKNINDFAKADFSKENIINDSITFQTTSEDKIDYNSPVLYNNCANPITLCYVNSNIKDEFALSRNISNIAYNGSLLKTCGITLNSISCKISFNINIINNLDESFNCPVTLSIPLSTEKSTIYDGTLTVKDSTNYDFIL